MDKKTFIFIFLIIIPVFLAVLLVFAPKKLKDIFPEKSPRGNESFLNDSEASPPKIETSWPAGPDRPSGSGQNKD